jgi:hypothetical protein
MLERALWNAVVIDLVNDQRQLLAKRVWSTSEWSGPKADIGGYRRSVRGQVPTTIHESVMITGRHHCHKHCQKQAHVLLSALTPVFPAIASMKPALTSNSTRPNSPTRTGATRARWVRASGNVPPSPSTRQNVRTSNCPDAGKRRIRRHRLGRPGWRTAAKERPSDQPYIEPGPRCGDKEAACRCSAQRHQAYRHDPGHH